MQAFELYIFQGLHVPISRGVESRHLTWWHMDEPYTTASFRFVRYNVYASLTPRLYARASSLVEQLIRGGYSQVFEEQRRDA